MSSVHICILNAPSLHKKYIIPHIYRAGITIKYRHKSKRQITNNIKTEVHLFNKQFVHQLLPMYHLIPEIT